MIPPIVIKFLKRFLLSKNGRMSTKRFAFLAQGFHYTILTYITHFWLMYVREYEMAINVLWLSAGLLALFGGFITWENIKVNKNDKEL